MNDACRLRVDFSETDQSYTWPAVSPRRSGHASAHFAMQGSHAALCAIDTMSGLVVYWDRDLLCRFANPAYLAWLGKPCQAVIAQRMQDVLGEAAFAQDEPHVLAALEGEPQTFERRGAGADGTPIYAQVTYVPDIAHGEVIGFIAHVTDVTVLRDLERRLNAQVDARSQDQADCKAAIARLEEAQRLGQIGSFEWHRETDRVSWSRELYRIFGLTDETRPALHAELASLFAPESWERLGLAMRRTLLTGEPYLAELRFKRADGSFGWLEVRGEANRMPGGRSSGLRGTAQDISRRREAEAAARKSQECLARLGSAAAIGGWEMDLVTRQISWSAELCRVHGMQGGYTSSLAELKDLYAPESGQVLEAAIAEAAASGKGFDVDLPVIRPDGTQRYMRSIGTAECVDGVAVRVVGTSQDVTEQRRLAAALDTKSRLLNVTLQIIGDAVILTAADGSVSWLNPTAERFTGWPAADAVGVKLDEVFHSVDEQSQDPLENPVAACLAKRARPGLYSPALLKARDGRQYAIDSCASPIRGDDGALIGFVLVFRDMSENRRMAGEMTYRASHDSLTGLINRAEFETRLARTLQRAKEDGSEHTLLYIDLDQFKVINDTCGHAVGDHLLREVARLLTGCVRASDTLARLGGDEFAIILEGCESPRAQGIAQKICDRMDDFRFIHDEERRRVGASIGLVPINERCAGVSAIWQAADTACYAAKEAGRNRVHVWYETDLAMQARQLQSQWTSRIERALDEDSFVLFAQRIEPLHVGTKGARAEVLLRMRNDDGSLTLPGAFLPAAERFHLISRVDRWVVGRAIAWMTEAPSLGGIDTLCVNLSGLSVGDRAFHAWAGKVLADAGPEICSRLCLEITETAAITSPADAASFIRAVRALGVRVALDDFGAGASSFGYLKSLPVDYLKIDGQFIRDLVTDKLDRAAVRCFVDVAKAIGVKTVAEFVDDQTVLEHLHEIGVDFAQGFLLHRPEPIEALFA